MTYGHRAHPLGNQVRLSNDEGDTWSDPYIISSDGKTIDLGYPTTVELSQEGHFYTVWYERMATGMAVLRAAKWRLTELETKSY